MNLQTGAFGDPQSLRTLILFWTKMELLHYPGAGETRAYLEEELQQQAAQAMQQQMTLQMQAQNAPGPSQGRNIRAAHDADAMAVIDQARQDAERDAGVL